MKWAKHKMYEPTNHRGMVAPALRAFLSSLRSTTTRAFDRVRRQRTIGNMNGAVKYTMSWLKERQLTFAPFDKESGVCLVKRERLEKVKVKVMQSQFYEPVDELCLNALQADFRKQYFGWAKLVKKVEDNERIGQVIRRSMNCMNAWYSK